MTAPPAPAPVVLPPLVEPRQHDRDDDPHPRARYDRAHFDRDED